MTVSLDGKVVVIAGAAGALGQAVCSACLEAGAHVVAAARNPAALRALASGLAVPEERLITSAADLADPAGAGRLASEAVARHGRIDALVNAAGAWEGGHPLWEGDPAVYDRMLDANLRTTFLLARAIVPHLLAGGGGAVVGVASTAARAGQAGAAAYAASKAALLALLASLREDLRGRAVRVNAVVPDVIDTPANRRAMPGADVSRWTRPEDIARVIAFLLSDAARAVHGAEIPVTVP
jgi:NAD(P)-dependent dehydrogenase (short-subunit alcohol dehydrogenase family)